MLYVLIIKLLRQPVAWDYVDWSLFFYSSNYLLKTASLQDQEGGYTATQCQTMQKDNKY